MLYLLLQHLALQTAIKIPAAFFYVSTRMILAAMTTLFLTIFLGPRVINKLYALKTGRSIRVEDCPVLAELHQKKKETPTMGGILILVSMLVALFLWMDLRSSFTLILALSTVWLGFVGGMDDYLKMKHKNSKGLAPKKKFFLQLLFAIFLGLYLLWPPLSNALNSGEWFSPPLAHYGDYYFPFKKGALFVLSGAGMILAFIITIIVVTGASNAVNLTDGLDGLAAGCILLVAALFAIFAFLSNNAAMAHFLNIPYIEGCGEIGIYLCAMGGACLGFLWYNGYPAQVFMGDTGSLALGGVLGTSAILMRREFLLALVGGVFVVEALSVILQVGSYRFRNKKRIFRCAPLHHHFEFKGWPEQKVVTRFWIVGLILTLIGLASIKFQ
ncbi:MAG: phospho-N-acetylmuramoyl-pentapeptide-transferase [Chlamydiia bacterium]|nr:phospho-N-acetylmuramoyl-pentapeptide-transferase [Chlamydiia bacterium]